ncbi:hypothetical protein SAMD00019534_059420 [Acytostelium subglobosum LB1]|uniref:hypothetical protein n=1 Tax=Acytostelium subglobosum LB1 TaxID=1410327 RepID=UPI000644A1F9|nr:hypothetical protein SAMD00019534_059420 [Acytostelium subglobosum LB1]GAM22767.1 hypothetical protein SAMD00019534_059420 [Acytostelium subglobosum LB1]|eukprot:XP_012753994.1 hypothetical protein SAMD00019534_059420 [Acytostelium subglobosum LB1]
MGLAEVMHTMANYFRCYIPYVDNHKHAVAALQKIYQEQPKVRKEIERLSACPEVQGINLEGYMVLPVARINRYHLLMTDLLRAQLNPREHEMVTKSIGMLDTLCTRFNFDSFCL